MRPRPPFFQPARSVRRCYGSPSREARRRRLRRMGMRKPREGELSWVGGGLEGARCKSKVSGYSNRQTGCLNVSSCHKIILKTLTLRTSEWERDGEDPHVRCLGTAPPHHGCFQGLCVTSSKFCVRKIRRQQEYCLNSSVYQRQCKIGK